MCFSCLPVDHPPMEPSQFVSVVPKYPDKMGFNEVGKVSVCMCTCAPVYIMLICLYQNTSLTHVWEPARPAWLLKRNQGLGKGSQFLLCLSSLILKKEHHGKSKLMIESERRYYLVMKVIFSRSRYCHILSSFKGKVRKIYSLGIGGL